MTATAPLPAPLPAHTRHAPSRQHAAAPPAILPLTPARLTHRTTAPSPAHAPPPAPGAAHRRTPPRPARHPRTACGPARGGRDELAARFALRLVEVLSGARPAGQLARHTTHDGYRQLAGLVRGGPLRARGALARPRLGPVHGFAPGPGSLEVCVRVETGARHHMVAFRLERHRQTEQWQCAAVEAR